MVKTISLSSRGRSKKGKMSCSGDSGLTVCKDNIVIDLVDIGEAWLVVVVLVVVACRRVISLGSSHFYS